MSDAWEPFHRLREAIEQAVKPLGVDLEGWVIMPGRTQLDPNACQVMFSIRPEAFKSETDVALDKQFEEMIEAERRRESERRSVEIRDQLLQISRDGILKEDDDDE